MAGKSLRIPGRGSLYTHDSVTGDFYHCIIADDNHVGLLLEIAWDMLAAGRRRSLSIGILASGYNREELTQAGAFRVYLGPAPMLEHIEDSRNVEWARLKHGCGLHAPGSFN